jgi:hypothetical protein
MKLRVWSFLFFAFGSSGAIAGDRSKNEVKITRDWESSSIEATGSSYGAYNSADSNQFIRCTAGASSVDATGLPTLAVFCEAKDAAGVYVKCTMVRPTTDMINIIRSIGDTQVITFKATYDRCTQVYVQFPGRTTPTTPNP